MINQLISRRVIFCGGKGGVGKTTVASALALAAAEQGRRVLLVSTDPAHSLGDVFLQKLDDRPQTVAAGVEALELDPDAAAQAYIDNVKQRLRDYVPPSLYEELDRQMQQARLSPGAVEAALLERIAGLIVAPPADVDLIIFDTAPGGHTLRLLSLPETMAAWTEGLLGQQQRTHDLGRRFAGLFGRADDRADRDEQLEQVLNERMRLFRQARTVLQDPEQTAFLLVLIPESLPILETERALKTLALAGVPVAGLIVNRLLPDNVEGEFMQARQETEAGHRADIERRFAALPRLELPLLARDVSREQGLAELAREIGIR